MKPYYTDDAVTLYHGDAERVAEKLEGGMVRTIVTSPPYFGLRDYGEDGQIGAERSLEEYITRLLFLFRDLREVLTDDGTLWLNLGDSYGAGKQLLGVPWRVAFALQDDGWVLRSDIIWAKPNPMPESVTDRPTKAHEYLFLLAKSPRYYYDAVAVADQVRPENRAHAERYSATKRHSIRANPNRNDAGGVEASQAGFGRADLSTRNKRTVWEIAPVPFSGAHFAVYPPELIRPCILAGSAPGDTVLDPFSGSGTTGMVATQEGRKYIGIDLNRDYLDLSLRTRFAQPVLNLEGIA
ncbi:DNA modification methylase [Agromyces sp. 3263]|uniref:DNA-methyltransferase n=1 Tax=Agromyces sp. 3263 TaxID=2817750 RepID=UPI002854A036|nr:site-specific DNA-methyltransferase [Agromyces sp. 3263]MDR6907492.1 DNA modification methylase [Agromyces sp. 3263]